ncbi:helix-turn-helix domain-containing protein [Phytohabitans houttuyneae]|uniref:Transcriptional regulator n=1 Tax=Phytohabitans houttuyneae TaxID=1076126 RepID=A0A6V8KUS1_9ACTN|nr:helix-turn-helix transcriptional regulator [Phytohabitans houttuyneae]GFJ85616.1 transcriptional regulator [Phytohabitans houttuyneae]
MTGLPEQDRPVDGPTAVRIIVGAQLRQLREERGLTRAEAGETIRASESKLSRMELGRVGFKVRDVKDLLTLYGVDDETEREAVLARVRQANEPGWWQPYSDVTPNWFQRYLGLEATASLIRTYEVAFVPGLLQTEEYARAVMRLNHGVGQLEEVERRVRLRLERQQVLTRPDPPRLWAVVDEAALRRPVGGKRVMRDQLESLISVVIKAPNVSLQVVPLAAGGYAAAGSPFTILRFPQASLPDVVYMEQLAGALYLDKREDVDHYFDAVNRLFVEAAPVRDTVRILDRIIHDLDEAPD